MAAEDEGSPAVRWPRRVALPNGWYPNPDGDPVARFDGPTALLLWPDGRVTWEES